MYTHTRAIGLSSSMGESDSDSKTPGCPMKFLYLYPKIIDLMHPYLAPFSHITQHGKQYELVGRLFSSTGVLNSDRWKWDCVAWSCLVGIRLSTGFRGAFVFHMADDDC